MKNNRKLFIALAGVLCAAVVFCAGFLIGKNTEKGARAKEIEHRIGGCANGLAGAWNSVKAGLNASPESKVSDAAVIGALTEVETCYRTWLSLLDEKDRLSASGSGTGYAYEKQYGTSVFLRYFLQEAKAPSSSYDLKGDALKLADAFLKDFPEQQKKGAYTLPGVPDLPGLAQSLSCWEDLKWPLE